MKKIGIMGGTFDPIHIGHLILAQTALEQFGLDEIYFMPSNVPPHKADLDITPAPLRLKMVAAAIADNPCFLLSDMEMQRSGYTYTYKTLQMLCDTHPDTRFYFIMGADSLQDFDTWRHPEIITKLCVLLAANREDKPNELLAAKIAQIRRLYDADVRLLMIPALEISSHQLRQRVSCGKSIRYLVPETVLQIIKENGLYQTVSQPVNS